MLKLSELGISPAPWTGNFCGRVEDANGEFVATSNNSRVGQFIAAEPELYDALYDAWKRACLSPSRKCKMCPYSGMYCNSWRAALAKASGESEVAK